MTENFKIDWDRERLQNRIGCLAQEIAEATDLPTAMQKTEQLRPMLKEFYNAKQSVSHSDVYWLYIDEVGSLADKFYRYWQQHYPNIPQIECQLHERLVDWARLHQCKDVWDFHTTGIDLTYTCFDAQYFDIRPETGEEAVHDLKLLADLLAWGRTQQLPLFPHETLWRVAFLLNTVTREQYENRPLPGPVVLRQKDEDEDEDEDE
jgi:hypothetical protein